MIGAILTFGKIAVAVGVDVKFASRFSRMWLEYFMFEIDGGSALHRLEPDKVLIFSSILV